MFSYTLIFKKTKYDKLGIKTYIFGTANKYVKTNGLKWILDFYFFSLSFKINFVLLVKVAKIFFFLIKIFYKDKFI